MSYVSVDNGRYALWQTAVTETLAIYWGVPGHTYAFYSVAVDRVGNVEPPPAVPDAVTTVAAGYDIYLPMVFKE